MKTGWQEKSLGEVAKVGAGNSAPQDAALFKDGIHPFFRTSDAGRIKFGNIDESTDYLNEQGIKGLRHFSAGTILLPKSGASTFLNHRIILGVNGYVSSHLATIEANKTQVHELFLLYFLSTISAQDLVQDHSYPSLNLPIVSGIKIPLPSLVEQERIVSILDQAFEGIAKARANAEKNLQNAHALFESHLQSIFSEYKKGWTTKTVGELVTDGVLYKPFDGNHGEIHPRKSDFTVTGVPFVMASDLVNGLVDTENCNHISKKLADSLRVGFAINGDVLISHKGTIGRSAIVKTSHEYIMLTPQVTAYRIKDKTRFLNKFIRYYFMSPIFQNEIISAAQDGSTRAYIGITRQSNLKFIFPSLTEQQSIVDKLDQLLPETQRLEALYQRKIILLDELKKSLLQQAFAGEL